MIIGVDVSKYNLGWNPEMSKAPIGFVIQRASWSLYKDEQFDALYQQVSKIPIRGAYHYYSSGVPWKAQAESFLSITNGRFDFYAVDYEKLYNNLSMRTIAEVYEMVKFIKAATGKRCLLYFSPDVWNIAIKPYKYDNWVNSTDVWIAQYPWTMVMDGTAQFKSPYLPTGLKKWDFWQYGGGDVNFTAGRKAGAMYGGGLQGIDLNYFNGELAQLQEWVKNTPVTPPPADNRYMVTVPQLNIRSGPSVSYSIIGQYHTDDKFVLYETKKIGSDTWGRSETGWIALVYNGFNYTTWRP